MFYLDVDFAPFRRSVASYVTETRRERCVKENIKDITSPTITNIIK